MKNGCNTNENMNGGTEFWNNNYKQYIRTIKFSNDLSNLPTNCTEENLCFDITESGSSEKVYGYLIDSGLKDSTDNTKVLYNLYIVSDSLIFAPAICNDIFNGFKNLVSIDFNNNFNTSNVTNMTYMFYGCTKIENLKIDNFNTSKVTNMSYMFYYCSSLKELDITNFNTANVKGTVYMFRECTSLLKLDLSNFSTINLKETYCMFYNCNSLSTEITIMNPNTNYNSIFALAATNENAKIIVNYTEETSTLVDNIITNKNENSNIVKGCQL